MQYQDSGGRDDYTLLYNETSGDLQSERTVQLEPQEWDTAGTPARLGYDDASNGGSGFHFFHATPQKSSGGGTGAYQGCHGDYPSAALVLASRSGNAAEQSGTTDHGTD